MQADFITTVGNKNLLTLAAEAQAKTGHDVQAFPTWEVQNYADQLEPMDDVMDAAERPSTASSTRSANTSAKVKGHWLAVPTSSGTQNKGPAAASAC